MTALLTMTKQIRQIATFGWLAVLLSSIDIPQVLAAQDPNLWEYCSPLFVPPDLETDSSPQGQKVAPGEIHVTSDSARIEKLQIYHFEGNVIFQQSDGTLSTDHAIYDRARNKVNATGAVRYQTGQHVLIGNRAEVYVDGDRANISDAEFWLVDNHLRGSAQSISIVSDDVLDLKNVSITSCDKKDESWLLKSSSLHLDFAANKGVARHARVEFMRVPFLYLPYMSLPIKGRKTGFLAPNFGNSNTSGTEISLPYYFNLAPNRDATITPRYLSKRGVQFSGEFRYLDKKYEGILEAEYLSNDKAFGDEDRSYVEYLHSGNPSRGWRTQIQYRYVSDDNYFDDFWNTLSASSLTYLERHLNVEYQSKDWRAQGKVQTFQNLDETLAATDLPYERLPQLQLVTNPFFLNYGLETSATTELVYFFRNEGVTGARFDLTPEIAWPYRAPAGFIDPTVKLRYTHYKLGSNSPTYPDSSNRTIAQSSLDSGLFFEREIESDHGQLVQTLEPRLYYLYVPYQDQDDIPIFDTTQPLFSFSELFRDNRFSGLDRIGDANQLSFSLTTRVFNDSGNELLVATLGQIYYFEDREVVLPGEDPDTRSQSDITGMLSSQWSRKVRTTANIEWNPLSHQVDKGSVEFRYQFSRDKIANLVYRFEQEAIDQVDLSILWPLRQQWKVYGRYYYSFLDDILLETIGGIEYESCCWALRLLYRNYITDLAIDERNDSILFQFELKGLASVGRKVKTTFDTGQLPGL
jgi:LPS-assembly protein